eukprot:jgi/Phyca11/126359/e_gw1.62.134.1
MRTTITTRPSRSRCSSKGTTRDAGKKRRRNEPRIARFACSTYSFRSDFTTPSSPLGPVQSARARSSWINVLGGHSDNKVNVEFGSLVCPDRSQTVANSAPKLHKRWRDVSGKFARVETGLKKSGEHGDDYWQYCGAIADVFYLYQWCEHRSTGREFCLANIYSVDEDDSQKEVTSRAKKSNRKRQNSSQAEVLAALAERVGAIVVANETSEAQEATW